MLRNERKKWIKNEIQKSSSVQAVVQLHEEKMVSGPPMRTHASTHQADTDDKTCFDQSQRNESIASQRNHKTAGISIATESNASTDSRDCDVQIKLNFGEKLKSSSLVFHPPTSANPRFTFPANV